MRHRRELLARLGLAILAVAMVLPAPSILQTEVWRPVFDLAHLPVFGALALWLLAHGEASGEDRPVAKTCVAVTGVIVAVELVQPLFGRSGSREDALAGMAGLLIAVTGREVWRRGRPALWRAGHALASLGLAVAVSWSSLERIEALRWQASHFPVLADFESAQERALWKTFPASEPPGEACPADPTRSREELVFRTTPGTHSGVRYQASDRDWRGYRELAFDLYRPDDAPQLNLRVDDDGGSDAEEDRSRFHRPLELAPGWNQVRVPLAELKAGPEEDGPLNLAAIRQIVLFAGADEEGEGLYCLDYVRLE